MRNYGNLFCIEKIGTFIRENYFIYFEKIMPLKTILDEFYSGFLFFMNLIFVNKITLNIIKILIIALLFIAVSLRSLAYGIFYIHDFEIVRLYIPILLCLYIVIRLEMAFNNLNLQMSVHYKQN